MSVQPFTVTILKLVESETDPAQNKVLLSAPADKFPDHQPGDLLSSAILETGGGHEVLEVGSFGTVEEEIAELQGVEGLAGTVQIVVDAEDAAGRSFTAGTTLGAAYFGPTLSLIELPDTSAGISIADEPAVAVTGIGADNPS